MDVLIGETVIFRKVFMFSAIILCLVFLMVASGDAAEYYVSVSGSDSNDGSISAPWRTIQYGVDRLNPGDTLNVMGGTYSEIVSINRSGTTGSYIAVQAYQGQKVIIDGGGKTGWGAILSIRGQDYVRIKGLEIRNNSSGWGILIEHEEGNTSNPATFVELIGLEVHDTGGEGIQLRGNVNNILVENCVVHDTSTYSGIDVYQWDGGRPNHVTIRGCTTYNSPSFAGIASEQADFLLVERNTSYGNGLGIDIGSGDKNIIRYNNVYNCGTGIALSSNEDSQVYGNTIHDISDEAIYSYYWILHGEGHARNRWYGNVIYNAGFGIFESNAKPGYGSGPSSDHMYYSNLFYNIGSHGSYRAPFYFSGVTGVKFYNNTLYMNSDYDGPHLVNDSSNAELLNNIIVVSGNASPVVIDTSSSIGTTVDYNCYFNRSGAVSGPGTHSITGDPQFVDPVSGNFRLLATSPCIDAGMFAASYLEKDLEGKPRCDEPAKVNRGAGTITYLDVGAYEYPCGVKTPSPPKNLRIE